ncbi:hypothetical protein A3G55_03565 [Candidatus Giovannonibacteria bacterium RIFCSPLOWO2_12_FULL_44_25]|nr:MAG: hypothetical protein A2120_02035 [Candidatus Giovannonibacteria bacterium GWA2_45_15]OGF60136.1 MAG: hypothetical protein A2W40_00900 [Candidatus Giovannonibacteria bacterium RIFCSPHIGHO2_01_45_12]OGF85371.1 MAG: hypothetical protein A3A19_04755 [Candidatus Giovannonibacteria bacterium RIFCSPLOWO2_01_FULL_45_140]OGF93027.1 MAG: hypothetical protein A3G55_03565 [Candidatus Giovannonibacteria bacterium RIFCSPLOWO2_12_FULL_44_25]
MIYLPNKPPHQKFWCGGKKSYTLIILWAVLVALVFFNKSHALIQNIIVKTSMFLVPERLAQKDSANIALFLEQIRALKFENNKLKTALEIQNHYRVIPAKIKFGGGYLFIDYVFADEGAKSGIKENNIVVTENNVLVGQVEAVGANWSKIKKTGSLGQKLTLIGEDPNLSFDAVGLGGGELAAELPARLSAVFKPGDTLRWAENPNYTVGLIDKIDFKEGNPFGKILIVSPISPSAVIWVNILPNND